MIPATIHLFKVPAGEHTHVSEWVSVCVYVWCGGMGCLHRTSHYQKTSWGLLFFSCMYLNFKKWTTQEMSIKCQHTLTCCQIKTVNGIMEKSVITEIPSYEKMWVMLVVLADSNKVTPYVILNCKTMCKEQMTRGTTVRC